MYYTAIKDIRYLFRLLRDIRNVFEHEEEKNYYKPVRVSIFLTNNYIKHKSKGDRNKTLQLKNKIRPYFILLYTQYHKWSQKMWHVDNSINKKN